MALLLMLPVAILQAVIVYSLVKSYNAKRSAEAEALEDAEFNFDADLKPSTAAIAAGFLAIVAVPVLFYKMYGWKGLPAAAAFLGVMHLAWLCTAGAVAAILS